MQKQFENLNLNEMNWSSAEAMKFLVRRELHGDELVYQEIKAAGKTCKRSIGLIERAMKTDAQHNRPEQVEAHTQQIKMLRNEQRLIDSRLIDCRNPDATMLSTYIDLHGCNLEQGARVISNHLCML